MGDNEKNLFALIAYGLGNTDTCELHSYCEWPTLIKLAILHGVGAIVLDALQRLYDNNINVSIDYTSKIDLIGVSKQQEQTYAKQQEALTSLARFYNGHDIKMMVLKGYGISLNYPIPNHRPCTDLDIYLFGDQKKADCLIEEQLRIRVDNSEHHHSVFTYRNVKVENHYDFLNIHSHLSSRAIERNLKEMASIERNEILVNEEKIYLPSANFNALFLLRHSSAHFAAEGMTIRMVLDWAFFIKTWYNAIDWPKFTELVKRYNMQDFYDAQNYICYQYLGFDKQLFPQIGDNKYGERVWRDLFNPQNMAPYEKGVLRYIYSRCKIWWRSRWKHKISYSDGLFSTFFMQLWAHLMKPATLHN